jgi:hypothetical protein
MISVPVERLSNAVVSAHGTVRVHGAAVEPCGAAYRTGCDVADANEPPTKSGNPDKRARTEVTAESRCAIKDVIARA